MTQVSIRGRVERYWRVACVIVGCWTFLALLFTPQTYLANLRSPAPPTWGQALLASLILSPGGAVGKGNRTAKWAADSNSFEVNEKATFDTLEGAVTVQTTRKWTLSPDGKTLRIEMTVDGPNGKQLLKRTFIRK